MGRLCFVYFYMLNSLLLPGLLNQQPVLINNNNFHIRKLFERRAWFGGDIKFVSHGGFFKVAQHSTVVVGIILII